MTVGECQRCGRSPTELQYLILTSKIKTSELELCNICFNAARNLWLNFMSYRKPKEY